MGALSSNLLTCFLLIEIVRLVPDEDVIKKEITSYRRPMKKKRTGSSANYKKRTRQIEEDEEGIHFSEEEGEDGKSKSLQSILVKDIATNTMVEKGKRKGSVCKNLKPTLTNFPFLSELFVSQSMVDWQESSEGCEYAKTQDFVESGASTGFISLKPGGEKPNKNTKANTLVKNMGERYYDSISSSPPLP